MEKCQWQTYFAFVWLKRMSCFIWPSPWHRWRSLLDPLSRRGTKMARGIVTWWDTEPWRGRDRISTPGCWLQVTPQALSPQPHFQKHLFYLISDIIHCFQFKWLIRSWVSAWTLAMTFPHHDASVGSHLPSRQDACPGPMEQIPWVRGGHPGLQFELSYGCSVWLTSLCLRFIISKWEFEPLAIFSGCWELTYVKAFWKRYKHCTNVGVIMIKAIKGLITDKWWVFMPP